MLALVATVLVPIPDTVFDPTEVAVSWQTLTAHGHTVVFSTESGVQAVADDIMLTGRGLDVWSKVPGMSRVVVVGRILRANRDARAAYGRMLASPEYRQPGAWADTDLVGVDGLLLPGGHRARGMRTHTEILSARRSLRRNLVRICHGSCCCRTVDPATGRSVLYGHKTTALTWELERRAWRMARVTRFWDPDYYRTYVEKRDDPIGYMSVDAEVTRALQNADDFRDVAMGSKDWRLKTSGIARDSVSNARPAFVVDDGGYVSARWPGDTHTFAATVSAKLLGGSG